MAGRGAIASASHSFDNYGVMNCSVLQLEKGPYGAPGLVEMPMTTLGALDETNGKTLPTLRKDLASLEEVCEFQGRLEVPGAPFVMPEQNFVARFITNQTVIFENRPAPPWPKISIKLAANPVTGNFNNVEHFRVRPGENTSDAEITYSRVQFALSRNCKCALSFSDGEKIMPFRFDTLSPVDEQQLLHRAKIFRKLKYIEWVFRTNFAYPLEISSDDVAAIDFIFRAITEGEFVVRQREITLPFDASTIELTSPPFSGPGALVYQCAEDWLELFGRRILVGQPTVTLNHAELANPQAVRQIQQGQPRMVLVRFDILDHQTHIRFENRATRSAKRLQQRKLERFKQELAREDPPELVELMSESLASDMDASEAVQIAVGWLYYNHLPDRFSPQEPSLDRAANYWRVPIHLVYANGRGGPVGELVIDRKTGAVISHTPVEELRSKGLALTTNILHAL
jgi:hypothetical protein